MTPRYPSLYQLDTRVWQTERSRVLGRTATLGQCRVRLPLEELRGRDVLLYDTLSGVSYERSGDELLAVGLYLDVVGWGHHAFEVSPLS